MSPENAKVIIIDDLPEYSETLQEFLEMDGHQVVGIADSLITGKELIDQLAEEKITKVDVALIDGNLSGHSKNGSDGQFLAGKVREKLPQTTVIAISMDTQKWSDRPDITKGSGCGKISKAVTEA